jgi:hypothetical protein
MSEQWKVEYDQRQYRLMLDHLDAYREMKIGIHALISALKGLLSALELRNDDWVQRAISEWGNLEIAYALECDRCEEAGRDLKGVDKQLFEMDTVKASISNMEQLARERLDASVCGKPCDKPS